MKDFKKTSICCCGQSRYPELSDVENPSHERQVSPHGVRGFCEQQEIKVDEKEKAVKKIREERGEKSSIEKLGDENEEEEEKLDEGEKIITTKIGRRK